MSDDKARGAFEKWVRENVPEELQVWMDAGYHNFKAYKPFIDGFNTAIASQQERIDALQKQATGMRVAHRESFERMERKNAELEAQLEEARLHTAIAWGNDKTGDAGKALAKFRAEARKEGMMMAAEICREISEVAFEESRGNADHYDGIGCGALDCAEAIRKEAGGEGE